MSPEKLSINQEDKQPLVIREDTTGFALPNSSVENLNLTDPYNPFASFDEVFYHSNGNKIRQSSRTKRSKYYQSVGELLWLRGQIYSDVKLSFEDRGVLALKAGIPSELRLHSLVLSQSQFFKEQLSVTSSAVPTSPSSNMVREKQIIVRLPPRVNEEDMINFYCTLKLMYTKNWDGELANNLTKGVGCLSVCCEISFHEGIEACWKWLVKKCNRDNNKEMMRRLIEAYPNLHNRFTPDESMSSFTLQRSSSKSKRISVSRRSSRRSSRRKTSNGNGGYSKQPLLKSNRSDTSISSDSSASPRLRYETELPYPPSLSLSPSIPSPLLSNSENSPTNSSFPSLPSISPPSIFGSARILNSWITYFESYAISSKRACSKMSIESRQDAKCFPFLEHFVSIFESINQLGRAKRITSPEALDYTLRMLNVIKIEHAHFHTLHMPKQSKSFASPKYSTPPKSPTSPKSPASPESPKPSKSFGSLKSPDFNKSLPSLPQRISPQQRRHTSRPSSSLLLSPLSPLSPSSPSSSSSSSPPSSPSSLLPPPPPPAPSSNFNNAPPIVLHESLDEPLSQIMRNILAPIEQKHLCDYLWAPSNISNLMHLREIRSDDDDDMEDEFDGYDQVMGEESLVKASRVSRVEHMVVGERMAKRIREVRSNVRST